MIRTIIAAVVCSCAFSAIPAFAQDATPAPPPGPAANTTPETDEDGLLGGELTPGAGVAAIGLGIAIIAFAGGGDDPSTTTTTTSP